MTYILCNTVTKEVMRYTQIMIFVHTGMIYVHHTAIEHCVVLTGTMNNELLLHVVITLYLIPTRDCFHFEESQDVYGTKEVQGFLLKLSYHLRR